MEMLLLWILVSQLWGLAVKWCCCLTSVLQRSAISMKKKKSASGGSAYGELGMMCMWGLLSPTLWCCVEVWRVKGSNTHMFLNACVSGCQALAPGWGGHSCTVSSEAFRLTAMTVRESHFVWHVLLCDGLYSTFMSMCTCKIMYKGWMSASFYGRGSQGCKKYCSHFHNIKHSVCKH